MYMVNEAIEHLLVARWLTLAFPDFIGLDSFGH